MLSLNGSRYYQKSILLIVCLYVAGTYSIWQENVRPKLYVELGKYHQFFYIRLLASLSLYDGEAERFSRLFNRYGTFFIWYSIEQGCTFGVYRNLLISFKWKNCINRIIFVSRFAQWCNQTARFECVPQYV